MLSWWTNNKTKEYKNRLIKCFPALLKSDVEAAIKVLPLTKNDVKLCDGKIHHVDNLIHPDQLVIRFSGEQLTIPYRFYFDEPEVDSEGKLSVIQKAILDCIFLRHHNGYLRERRLKNLVHKNENWIVPFTFQLLGEYVYEILEVLDEHINEKTVVDYHSFTVQNPKYCQLTESRMISYWNEYYRSKFPKLKEYLGKTLINRIKMTPKYRPKYIP